MMRGHLPCTDICPVARRCPLIIGVLVYNMCLCISSDKSLIAMDTTLPTSSVTTKLARCSTTNAYDSMPTCPDSPRKQLRFDLNATQSSIRSNPDEIMLKPLVDKPPSGWGHSQTRTAGILKSKSPRTDRPSLTTDDISSSMLYSCRPGESRRRHTRSFSANARLSSTPIKTATSQEERPHISGLSSVHSANSAGTNSNLGYPGETNHNVLMQTGDKPMKYLYDAVSDAECRSQALGLYGTVMDRIPQTGAIQSRHIPDINPRTSQSRLGMVETCYIFLFFFIY